MKYKTIEEPDTNLEPQDIEETKEVETTETAVTKAIKNIVVLAKTQAIKYMRCEKTSKCFIKAYEPLIKWLLFTNPDNFKFPEIPETEVVEIDCEEVDSALKEMVKDINDAIQIVVSKNDWLAVSYLQKSLCGLLDQMEKLKK